MIVAVLGFNYGDKFYEYEFIFTLNSKAPTAIPEAAPVPASPMKCSLPILLAKRENPT